MRETENWAEHMKVLHVENVAGQMKGSSFDEALMEYLAAKNGGNFMASPLSFRYALGLLLAGAEGETKTELLKALGVKNEKAFTESCLRFNAFAENYEASFQRQLEQHREQVKQGWIPDDGNEPFMALRVANSVWRNELLNEMFTKKYTKKVSENYGAEYRSFLPENVVEEVNKWASIKTEKMIEKLLPDNYDAGDLAVILMNALYFKDNWVDEFSEEGTREEKFTTKNGKTVKKQFMHQTEHYQYYKDDATELVILPMEGGVKMAFVIGDQHDVASKINKAESRKVSVAIPKIDLETSFEQGEFVDFLKARGVNLAFDADFADFSGMIDTPVYVSDIIQKTRIKLDEKGVEAAAVTAIMVARSSYNPEKPIEFRADRPFSFYIYADAGNEMAVMFAGQIVK